jgi:CheY-like chemotaxis protein
MNVVANLLEDSADVLLIAGDTDVAEMYRMKLELDGYRVTIGNVGDPTACPAGWRPDIVLIDLGVGCGPQLLDLQRLRADPLLAEVPALLLSTRSEEELRTRGLRSVRPTTCCAPYSPHPDPPPQAGEGETNPRPSPKGGREICQSRPETTRQDDW